MLTFESDQFSTYAIGVPKCTVTFDAQGGSAVDAATAGYGEGITAPEAPTKSQHTFVGWYKDAACKTEWNFDTDTVTGDITLYAKWSENTLNNATVSVENETRVYKNADWEPTPTVRIGQSVIANTNYTVSYSNNKNAGSATVTVTGTNDYTGTASTTFTITQKALTDAMVELSGDLTYTGSALTKTVTVTDGVALEKNTDYTVSGDTNTNAGTNYAVTVKGKGNYSGTITKGYSIAKADPTIGTVTSAGTVYITTNPANVVLTRADTTVAGALKVTGITEFSATGTAQYDWTFTPTDTTNYETKTGKVEIDVLPNDLVSIAVVTRPTKTAYVYGDDFDKTGMVIRATYADGTTLQKSADKVTIEGGTALAVGTTSVTVNYTENSITKATTAAITVTEKPLTGAVITLGTSLTYTGNEQTQTVSKVELGGTELTADVDYTVSGNAKTNAGTFTLTISGTGNYTGTATKQFIIARAALTPSVSGAVEKVYDNKTTVPAAGANNTLAITLSGFVASDSSADVSASATFAYNAVNVGANLAVKATGITLSGTKAANYTLSATEASGNVGTITKATPIITLGNLNQKTNALGAVTAAINPASTGISATVEYEVVVTPAVPAKPGTPCKYEEGTHLEGCAALQENAQGDPIIVEQDCDCGLKDHTQAHNNCGYVAPEEAVPAVKDWVTTPPTAIGSYPVRAYLPDGGDNLNAIAVGDAVTGTLTITQYVAPPVVTPPSDNQGSNDNDKKEETKDETVTAPPLVPEVPVLIPEIPIIAPETTTVATAETTEPAVQEETRATTTRRPAAAEEEPEEKPARAEDATPVTLVETDEVTVEVAEGQDKTLITVEIEEGNEEAWDAVSEAITESIAAALEEADAAFVEIRINAEKATAIPAAIFEAIKGKDASVVLEVAEGISWTVNGNDVKNVDFASIDLLVIRGAGDVPESMVDELAGTDSEALKIRLVHDGEFGFKATLGIDVDKKNAGKYAKLYYYNELTKALEFVCEALIGSDGVALLDFVHASDYVIVIDNEPVATAAAAPAPAETAAPDSTTADSAPATVPGVVASTAANSGSGWIIWIVVIAVVVLLIGGGVVILMGRKKQ